MNEPIKVGDMVVVVRGHECSLGRVRQVDQLFREDGRGLLCEQCKAVWHPRKGLPMAQLGEGSFEVWTLKRIPPIYDLQGKKQKEDIREPA